MTLSRVVVATHNAHKVEELQRILTPLLPGVALEPYDGPEPEETGDTFEANALLKARAAHEHTGLPAIADDSGIAVAALDGAPGIFSARYAGTRNDQDNVTLLLRNLEGEHERSAEFVCAAAFVDAEDDRVIRGVWPGVVAERPSGQGGFGYDPIFVPADGGIDPETGAPRTAAQLAPSEKDALSHRRRAFEALASLLTSDA